MKIDFPLSLEICEDLTSVNNFLQRQLPLSFDKVALVTGQITSANYARDVVPDLFANAAVNIALDLNSIDKLYEKEKLLRDKDVNIIVAIGGGKVIDFSKRLAYIGNFRLIVLPTIIANDGLISPVAVLDDNGQSVSMPGKMPDSVALDLSIIKAAPQKYLRAAAGDIITNISATNDWSFAQDRVESGRINHLALQLSRMASYQIIDCREWSLDSDVFLRNLISGQILSGVAMAIAGSSRPCSGSEHLLSHAMDYNRIGMNVLHGTKVAITSRFCLYLQGKSDSSINEFSDHFKIPKEFPEPLNTTESELLKLFADAKKMRPGRVTILDEFTNAELLNEYSNYVG